MLEIAIQLASKLEYVRGQSRHCSIITDKRNRVVSVGYNSYTKSHPQQQRWGELTGNPHMCYVHSEFSALKKDKHKKGYKIYIARVDSENRPVYSKPCKACEEMLKNSHLKAVEYTL